MGSSKWIFGLTVVALLVVGVGAISAQETTDDGRVNYWDAGATAAIYCDFENIDADDGDKGAFTGIEVLHIDPATGNGVFALDATAAEIDTLIISSDTDQFLLEENGYQLWRTVDGGFRVNGGFYNFEWDRGDLYC